LTALGANSSAALTVQLGRMTLNSATVTVVVKLAVYFRCTPDYRIDKSFFV